MNIQEMLGEAYHEGMSIEEMNSALAGKKFADLSTGQYVDANKYNADIKARDAEIAKKTSELNSRLTDSEKDAASREADKARIKELEDLIQNQAISANRDKVESLTSDVRSILGLGNDDNDYSSLLNVLSNVEAENARSVAKFVNKIAKDSYEKGKKDATKDSLGNFSNGVGKQGSEPKQEIGAFGKQLASMNTQAKVDSNLYFSRNK